MQIANCPNYMYMPSIEGSWLTTLSSRTVFTQTRSPHEIFMNGWMPSFHTWQDQELPKSKKQRGKTTTKTSQSQGSPYSKLTSWFHWQKLSTTNEISYLWVIITKLACGLPHVISSHTGHTRWGIAAHDPWNMNAAMWILWTMKMTLNKCMLAKKGINYWSMEYESSLLNRVNVSLNTFMHCVHIFIIL